MTQGVGAMSQKGAGGSTLSPILQPLVPCQHCTAVHSKGSFQQGKIRPQGGKCLLPNQAAATRTQPWETNLPSPRSAGTLQFAQLNWILSTGSHSQFLCLQVRMGNNFFCSWSFTPKEKTSIHLPMFSSSGFKASNHSALSCHADIFSELLMRYERLKGLFSLSPIIWFYPLRGITSISAQAFSTKHLSNMIYL